MTLIIFGSTTGNTEAAAEKIAARLEEDTKVFSVAQVSNNDLEEADFLILGTSTWGFGDIQDDWEEGLSKLDNADISGKPAALFGLGDQEGYPDTFVDGMLPLKEALIRNGAVLKGTWSTEGYNFEHSAACSEDTFPGLALDEDNQSDLTDQRISDWISLLR